MKRRARGTPDDCSIGFPFGDFMTHFLQHANPLPDRQSDARPVPDGASANFLRFPEIVVGMQRGIDVHAVPHPRFDFAEIAVTRIRRPVRFSI
jgi:hypothetical protein